MNRISTSLLKTFLGLIVVFAIFFSSFRAESACRAHFGYVIKTLGVYLFDSSSVSNTSYLRKSNLGDGTSSTDKSLFHLYKTFGKYTICLYINDTAAKCKDSTCITINLQAPCSASYTYKRSGLKAFFTDASYTPNKHKVLYSFGDGTTSDSLNPVHTYAKPGKYRVCLKTTDSVANCNVYFCDSVFITNTCTAAWKLQKFGATIKFTDLSTTPNPVHKRLWKFPDSSSSTAEIAYFTFKKPGKYRVCLKVTDSLANCSSVYCDSVTVDTPRCKASFSYVMSGTTVKFTDGSSTPYGHKCTWTFGDNTSGTSTPAYHTYLKAGRYQVCLTVKDSVSNCSETYCDSVKVLGACRADFSVEQAGLTVKLTDKSSSPYSHKTHWLLGDSTTSDSANEYHTYKKAGAYKICLLISDSAGKCSTYVCQTVTVSKCNSDFIYYSSGQYAKFIARDSMQSKTATFTWDMGDGKTRTGNSFYYKYSKDSIYNVCLTVIDSAQSCSTSTCKKVTIKSIKNYSISGKVYAGSNDAYPGKVLLIGFDPADSTLKLLKYALIKHDSSGAHYLIDGLPTGTYYVKAVMDTTSAYYRGYLPTYHDSAAKWKDASKIIIANSNAYNVNIWLAKGSNPGGRGFVGGKISQGANKKEGDPLSDIEVLILDMNDQPVSYAFSNQSGDFRVEGLDAATYQVYGDVEGRETTPVIVTVSDNLPAPYVLLSVNTVKVWGTLATSGISKSLANTDFSVYPNPFSNSLTVSFSNGKSRSVEVRIYDITGRQVNGFAGKTAGNHNSVEIPVSNIPKGFYLLQINLPEEGKSTMLKVIRE